MNIYKKVETMSKKTGINFELKKLNSKNNGGLFELTTTVNKRLFRVITTDHDLFFIMFGIELATEMEKEKRKKEEKVQYYLQFLKKAAGEGIRDFSKNELLRVFRNTAAPQKCLKEMDKMIRHGLSIEDVYKMVVPPSLLD